MTTTEWFRSRARELYHEEGEIEIDDEALVSASDSLEGAYVQAWVWVPAQTTARAKKVEPNVLPPV